MFLDHSIVEVFLNATHCLTARVYADRHDSDGIYLASSEPAAAAAAGAIGIQELNCWKLRGTQEQRYEQ